MLGTIQRRFWTTLLFALPLTLLCWGFVSVPDAYAACVNNFSCPNTWRCEGGACVPPPPGPTTTIPTLNPSGGDVIVGGINCVTGLRGCPKMIDEITLTQLIKSAAESCLKKLGKGGDSAFPDCVKAAVSDALKNFYAAQWGLCLPVVGQILTCTTAATNALGYGFNTLWCQTYPQDPFCGNSIDTNYARCANSPTPSDCTTCCMRGVPGSTSSGGCIGSSSQGGNDTLCNDYLSGCTQKCNFCANPGWKKCPMQGVSQWVCTDLTTNSANCGSCGTRCNAGVACVNSVCANATTTRVTTTTRAITTTRATTTTRAITTTRATTTTSSTTRPTGAACVSRNSQRICALPAGGTCWPTCTQVPHAQTPGMAACPFQPNNDPCGVAANWCENRTSCPVTSSTRAPAGR
jgi:hypothetical protein